MPQRFYVETLGCPKNAVDSDKVVASLLADGLAPATEPGDADLVVVNTCAFIEAARQESIDVALALADVAQAGREARRHRLHGRALRRRARGGAPRGRRRRRLRGRGLALASVVLHGRKPTGVRDLLELPAPRAVRAVGVREGRRGLRPRVRVLRDPVVPRQAAVARHPRRSRPRRAAWSSRASSELVLVAQDLAWYGRDAGEPGALAPLLRRLDALSADGLTRVRLLYLYPVRGARPARRDDARAADRSSRTSTSRCSTPSAPLLRRMKRWGSGDRFLGAIDDIRAQEPERGVPIVVHRRLPRRDRATTTTQLLSFLDAAQLDWAGFFPFSDEAGTPAVALDGKVDAELGCSERLRECAEVQDPITPRRATALVGE